MLFSDVVGEEDLGEISEAVGALVETVRTVEEASSQLPQRAFSDEDFSRHPAAWRLKDALFSEAKQLALGPHYESPIPDFYGKVVTDLKLYKISAIR